MRRITTDVVIEGTKLERLLDIEWPLGAKFFETGVTGSYWIYLDGWKEITVTDQKTAFGELSVANLTPIVQLSFAYNIHADLILAPTNNGGTVTQTANKAKLQTSAAANAAAYMQSRVPIKYHPGQGALIRFTAIFTTGVPNSTQWIGIGDVDDGYFFGYNGDTFGVLRRQGGGREVRVLTITTGSSHAENVTITLDGDAKADVAVTNTADITLTANEIAAADYSDVGTGWSAHTMGAIVHFISYDTVSHSGSYSLSSATSAIGTFASSLVGATPTETVVNQENWNIDKMDGTGPSGMTFVPTLGNVMQIRYQWLGFGEIEYYIEASDTGLLQLCHRIEYANTSTVPSIDNPTLPLFAQVNNAANTSNITMETSSMGGFIEGDFHLAQIDKGASVEIAGVGTSETPVLTIHNHILFQSVFNKVAIIITEVAASVDGTKPSTIRIRRNATLTGASFSAIDTNLSVIFVDTSATALSGGELLEVEPAAKSDTIKFTKSLELEPGEFLTISLEASSGTVDAVITIDWDEEF